MADYLIHFNPNHDLKTGRFDFSVGARVNSLGAVVDRKGNVNTDIYKYIDKKGYASKKPMGLTKAGLNRLRKITEVANKTNELRRIYQDAEDRNDPNIDAYKKSYEDAIDFVKKNISEKIRETYGADEDGVRYIQLYIHDPLTRRVAFSSKSLADKATVNPDGTWVYKGKNHENY